MAGIKFLSEYMKDFQNDYVLIGGNACALQFSEVDVEFRETVDLDIVLLVDSVSNAFYTRLNDYLITNKYDGKVFNGSNPGGSAYRFTLPEELRDNDKPTQIELFSKKPEYFDPEQSKEMHITPLETGDGVSNFSAILLDDEIYNYIEKSKVLVQGVTTVSLECLLGLKSIAWHANQILYNEGKIKKHGDVIKHPSDMLTIISTLDEGDIYYPSAIYDSLQESKNKFSDKSLEEYISPGNISFQQAADFIDTYVKE